MTFTYPLPNDTRQKFTGRCSNLGLLIDRYVGYEQNWKFKEEQKTELFKKVSKEFKFSGDLVKANYQRWRSLAQSLPNAQIFTASPEWRMIVGLGQASILETSMTLDRVTGIPIIPGSALKGLTASYAMLCVRGETSREKAESNHDFKEILGTQKQAGKIIFLDAVPTKVPILEPDIMNCHYPEYYGGSQPPTPFQNPIPVYFLTLGKKSEFAFAVAARDSKSESLVETAKTWLKGGLSELGIGAKTAAGYGYLEIKP